MIKTITIMFDDTSKGDQFLNWSFDYTSTRAISIKDLYIDPPSWANLENHKCKHCSLNSDDFPFCPPSIAFYFYAKDLLNRKSTETATVVIKIDNRDLEIQYNNVPLQNIVSEVIRMAVIQSDCPIGKRARKIIDLLPPFPSTHEVTNAFALFFTIHELKNDTDIKSLIKKKKAVFKNLFSNLFKKSKKNDKNEKNIEYLGTLNNVFIMLSKRIQEFTKGDAGVNGLIINHALTMYIKLSLPKVMKKTIDSFGDKY